MDPADWNTYALSDQLAILSKLVLAYHRRKMGGANRIRVYVKDGHNVTITMTRVDHSSYQVSFELVIVDGSTSNHAIQLVSTDGVAVPFWGCTFAPSAIVIN
jgi:hypothetical protein